MAPFAVVVEFAHHTRRAAVRAPVVQFFLDLVFDQLALFFHHQDFFQALREFARALRLQRPAHRDLVHADADVARDILVYAEVGQRLHGVAVGLACRDDTQARARGIPNDAVQAVGAHIGERRIDLVVEQARFLFQNAVGPADAEAARRQHEVGRDLHLHPMRIDIHRCARLDHVGDAFESDPETGVARHGEAVQAVVQILLHVRRVQHRDAARFEYVFALVRERRGLGRVIVAGEYQHAAVFGGAGRIAVLEYVAAAVHARTFAVPDGEHAVVLGVVEQVELLRAPDRGRGHVFVDAGMELDVMGFEVFLRAVHALVYAAQGRAAITGDETCGVEAGGEVALALQHGQAHQRLGAGEEDAAGIECVLVVQRNFVELVWGVHW